MLSRFHVTAGALVAICGATFADIVIQPVDVTASNSWGGFANPRLMINGAGTAGGWPTIVHGSPIPQPWPGHSIWWNDGHYITEPTTPGHAILPTLVFDLGDIYTLNGMHFWNCNMQAELRSWGVRTATVSTSVDGIGYTEQPLGGLFEAGTFQIGLGWPEYAYQGETYTFKTQARYVRMNVTSNWGGECTSIAEVRFIGSTCAATSISSHPDDQAACIGTPVSFSVVAAGTDPLTYQWRVGQSAINPDDNSSAASATLVINQALAADAGAYDCVITNGCGQSISDAAVLNICPGDFNCDGGVDGSDIDAFFPEWESGNLLTDINADGGVDGSDVSAFFERWEAGC